MDLVTRDDFEKLINNNDGVSISIYLPTEVADFDVDKGRIRLKNLIGEARRELEGKDFSPKDIDKILSPAKKFLDDHKFWSHQREGLAIFLSENNFYYYKLPISFDEMVVVSNRFHIKPLMSLLSGDGEFYILALSQNKVRLLNCTHYSVEEVELEDVPESIDEALWHDDPEKQLQSHSGGNGSNIYHGNGAGDDDKKKNILRYFHKIDDGVYDMIKDQRCPLIVAAVDYMIPIYKDANSYPYLLDEGIEGNPDNLDSETLHQEGWNIVKDHFKEKQEEIINKYNDLSKTDYTSNDIEKIVPAAYNGRIDSLFVAKGIKQWGIYKEKTNSVNLNIKEEEKSEDLLDFSAVHTMLRDGDVYVLEAENIPGDKPYGAILRY